MTALEVSSCHVTLVHAGVRSDVSVPENLFLGEVADAVGAGSGLYLGRLALLDGDGRVLDPRQRVADAIESGAVLWLVDAEALLVADDATTRAPGGGGSAAAVARVQLCLLWVAVVLALAAAYVTRHLLPQATGIGWWSCAVSVVLAVAAVVLALRPGTDGVARFSRTAAPAFGLAAGVAFPFTVPEGSAQLAVAAGLVLASAVAALARVQAADDGVSHALMVGLSVAALVSVVGVLLDWPGHVGAALLAGASPLALRLLPSLSLDVPDDQLIDTERFATTVWSARIAPVGRRRSRVRPAGVRARVRRAKELMTTGAAAIATAATVGLAALLAGGEDASGLARWAAVAEGFLLVAALGLQTRSVRDRAPKVILQVATGVLLVEVMVGLRTRVPGPTYVLLLCVVLLLAVVGLVCAVGLGRGWRSVRLSRLGDLLEGLAVALVLPCALLGVDTIEAFRRITSG